jgi:hypothetical protein
MVSIFKKIGYLVWIAGFLSISGCGSGNSGVGPVQGLQKEMINEPEYAILLNDMREEGNFFPSYFHQYRVDMGENSDIRSYQMVTEDYYKRYEPYLGMVLASKTPDGKLSNTPFPNGYQHVGNSNYGRWRQDSSGGSFWEFYGKYALMSNLMGWAGGGLYRRDYNTYSNYRQNNKPYYGPKNSYGTNGTITQKQKPNFYARRKARKASSTSSFDKKVQKRKIGRSKNSFRSRGFSFGK